MSKTMKLQKQERIFASAYIFSGGVTYLQSLFAYDLMRLDVQSLVIPGHCGE